MRAAPSAAAARWAPRIGARAEVRHTHVGGRTRGATRVPVMRASGDTEDTLSAVDRLVPGVSREEEARTPPPAAEDRETPAVPPEAEARSGAIVREVSVELEPPENIAVASFEVASASTRVVQSVIAPPLGIAFEESSAGEIVVAEIIPGSNAERAGAGSVVVGDVLRACSAMIPEMKYSPGGLMLGGNGRPGFRRVLFVTPTGDDFAPGVSFDQTMAALVSNAKAGDFTINLVVERRSAWLGERVVRT